MSSFQESSEQVAPILWMYWEDRPGQRRPQYLDLCERTIIGHADGLEVRAVDQSSALDWLPTLDRRLWARLPNPASRADYVRTRLIYEYGGMWADADMIAIRPLREIIDNYARDDYDAVGYGREDKEFKNGLFAARAASPFVGRWAEEQDRVLLTRQEELRWTDLGKALASSLAHAHRIAWIPTRRIAPLPWFMWKKFLSPYASPQHVLAPSPFTVMLFNQKMREPFRTMSHGELLESPMLISRLLRIATGLSNVDEELDWRTRLHLVPDVRHGSAARATRVNINRAHRAATIAWERRPLRRPMGLEEV